MNRPVRSAALVAVLAAVVLAATAAARATPALGCRVNLWIHGRDYTGTVTRSYRTSCPFARRVAARSLTFVVNHGGVGNGDFYVRVYSPVTLRWYRMHCEANGDLYTSEGMTVACRGGIGAYVKYRAWRP